MIENTHKLRLETDYLMKRRSGQILILVLLVVVVALAVGLSVASRNITNLRTSTQTEQSQRAFSAAEGGVEDTLSNLTSIAANPNIGSGVNLNVPVGDITANVTVKATSIYEAAVEEGTVAQVNLDGYSGNVVVEWILTADTQTENLSPKASVEVSFICQNAAHCFVPTSSSGVYSQYRVAYQAETISGQDGFAQCTSNAPTDKYVCRANFTVAGSDNVKFMRVRPFWRKATVRVTGDSGFPVQTYDLISSATTDLGITRRVQVTRTALPQLPASFDYVLFSDTDIAK